MGLCKDGYWRESERYEGKKYIGIGKTQRDALKDLTKKLSDAKSGKTVLNQNTSVSAWADEWLKTYIRPRGMTDKSYLTYDEKVRIYIKPAVGTMRLKDVKEAHLQRLLNDERGKSFSHVAKLRMVTKQMFHKAYRQHLISFDPAEDLELPAAEKNKRRSITREERRAILSVARTHPAGPWILAILYCGLRPSETAALQWKDADFKKGVIHISQALESGKADDFKAPKTDAGVRDVPMPPQLAGVLKPMAGEPFGYIFTQRRNKGRHLTESSMRKMWLSFKRALDIELGAEVKDGEIVRSVVAEDLTPYCLRHTYCTDLEAAGVPINVAKVLMGHDDVSVTANIYTHKSDEAVKAASRKIKKQAAKNAAG